MLKKLLVTTCLSILILGFILFNCKLPAPPPGPDEAKVSLLLKSSNGKIDHTGSIQDSVGKEVQIGIVLNLTQYIDSSVVRVILDADTERTIPWAFKKNMVDTVFFPITFTKAGTHNVEITSYITGQPNSVAEGKIIIYGPLQENKKPELKVPGTQSAVVGQAVSFSVSASDPDAGQLVTISASQKPEHATFTADTFRWTPGVADTGTVKVVFIATDNGAPVMADIDTVTIIVNATKVNHTPQWYTKSMQRTIKTGTQFLYDLSSICSDPDNEKVTFSLIAAPPAGDTIIGSAYSFSPTGADTGKYTIHIMAQDSSGLTDTLTVGITVSTIDVPDSLPPVIHFKSPSKDTVISADSLEVKVSCIDDSGCSVKGYLDTTAFALKRSASIKSLWTGTVMGIAAGRYSTIKIVATDSSKAKNRDSSTVRIKYDNDKSGPVITLVNPVKDSVTINTSSYMVIVKVADPSGVLSVNGTSRDTIYTGVRDTGSLWKITISTLENNKVTAMVLTATDSSLKANKTLDTVYIKSEIVNGYKIKFDKNDSTATGTMADQTINSGDSAKLTTNTFVKTGSIFAGWMTSPTGTTVSYSDGAMFKIGTAPVTLYAKWVKKTTFTLTITAANGSVTKSPDATVYDSGTVVTLTPVPSTNYHFSGWSGALTDTANPSTITMNGDKSVTAGFVVNSPNTFTLTVAASNGTVKKTPDLPQYDSGSTVGLKAAASTGYRFVNWSGDAAGTTDSATVVVNKVKTVTANFIRTCTLTISSTNGTVTKSPDAAVYDSGTVVTLTPVPSTNYHFSGWSGALTGTANPSTITMNGDKSVTAGFVANPPNTFTLTITASNGSVKKTPDLPQYDSGSTIGLKASAGTGYKFVNWTGDATGTTDSTTVVINNVTNITANFSPIPYTVTFSSQGTTYSTATVNYNALATEPAAPQAGACYTFGGWYTSETYATKWDFTTDKITGTTTLFAKWTQLTYIVTYSPNGAASGTAPAQQTKTCGVALTLATNSGNLIKTDVTFSGWNTAADGTGTDYAQGVSYTANAPLALFAKWNTVYTVTYNANGGTGSVPVDTNKYQNGQVVTVPGAGALNRPDFTFAGWNTQADTLGTNVGVSFPMGSANVVLFAKWRMSAPVISTHPVSATCPVNESVTFNVVASGPGLTYQWQKNGGNIAGATAASYIPPALTVADTAATYRCVVSNAGGNVNSNGATLSISTLTDADGNVYHQVKIGTQIWTIENLRVTKTNDNTGIPKDTSSSTWYNATTPKFCFYSNSTDPAENKKWGALYNWHAVSTGKLAPPGWHVPDTTDWKKLERYLIDNGYNCDGTTAGNSIAHAIAATTDWSNTSIVCTPGENSSTNNESGFSALPSGYRSNTGGFTHRGVYCIWWTSSGQPNSVNARYRYITNTSSSLLEDNNTKDFGFSVRLVKD